MDITIKAIPNLIDRSAKGEVNLRAMELNIKVSPNRVEYIIPEIIGIISFLLFIFFLLR